MQVFLYLVGINDGDIQIPAAVRSRMTIREEFVQAVLTIFKSVDDIRLEHEDFDGENAELPPHDEQIEVVKNKLSALFTIIDKYFPKSN